MKCFYHNDLDGKGAASIVWMQADNPRKQDFISVNYIDSVPDASLVWPNEKVYIVDYSFTEATKRQLEAILEKTKDVVWIDHHKSSTVFVENNKKFFELFDNRWCDASIVYPTRIIDEAKSGALLVWEYFYPEVEAPTHIKYIDDYDRWIHQYKESIIFKTYMDSYNHTPWESIWECLMYADMNNIILEGTAIKRYADSQDTMYARRLAFETTINGIECIAICRPGNSTALAEKFNDYPLGVVFQYKDGVYSFSLYSKNKDIDCSKIAESFGGGGHKGAAGFTSNYVVLGKSKLYNNLRSLIKKLF